MELGPNPFPDTSNGRKFRGERATAIALIVAAEIVSAEFAVGLTTETVLRSSVFSQRGVQERRVP